MSSNRVFSFKEYYRNAADFYLAIQLRVGMSLGVLTRAPKKREEFAAVDERLYKAIGLITAILCFCNPR
jgi:hypothetical protein